MSLPRVHAALPLCAFQALESLQRAQELADGIGNKVNDPILFHLVRLGVTSHRLSPPPPPLFGVRSSVR